MTAATTTSPQLLLATANPGKLQEFRTLLPRRIAVVSLIELGYDAPPETGSTFAENAALKALAAATRSGILSLADDSGLEVDALDGAPGIYSARYAGEPPSDARNLRRLLIDLAEVVPAARTARFRCSVALADRAGVVATADGVVAGTITAEPIGTGGFGYDPLFRLADGRTMAELSEAEKNAISHRARAYRAILPDLLRYLDRASDSSS